ncbi:hypothetical protein [Paenibacillus sp. 1P07SE]|uniref:hypothetical protein n=1 Tax=Paenibacillus sp. 1P07SE TaxID=3132209 RepID=UPI0039A50A08
MKSKLISKGWAMLLVLCVTGIWGGNYYYYYAHKFDGAVMLDHYYETQVTPGETVNFYYVTHRSSSRELVAIRLSDGLYWHARYQQYHGEYGPYILKSAVVEIGYPDQTLPDQTYERFTEIEAWFNDGTVDTLPVGSIQFLPAPQPASSPVDTTFGMSSSDGDHRYDLRMMEDLRILDVYPTLGEKIGDALDYSLLSSPPEYTAVERAIQSGFPIELKRGQGTSVVYTIHIPDQDPRSLHVYRSSLRLSLELANGEHKTLDLPLRSYPQASKETIKELVERRTEAYGHES